MERSAEFAKYQELEVSWINVVLRLLILHFQFFNCIVESVQVIKVEHESWIQDWYFR